MNASASVIAPQPAVSPAVSSFLARPPRLFIGNEWVAPDSAATVIVIDPATGRQITAVPDANAVDVARAVATARAAFELGPWHDMKPMQRQALMWKLADLLEQHAPELAELESIDNGKPRHIAHAVDVLDSRDHLRYMAGWATRIEGATIPSSMGAPGQPYLYYTVREPVGVVGQIVPWNFPLSMAIWKVAPALAAGCTCVLKPAEQTPLTALRLGELAAEAGFPPGVLNVITGLGHTAGAALVAHPGVDKIAFTGSTEIGKLINKSATDTMKRVTLELGGKSPVIVLPDADIEQVIAGAADAIFFNSGQVCTAGSRLYAHRKVFDRVVEGVSAVAAKLRLGPGLLPDTELGPLVSKEQQARVLGYIDSGRQEGAKVMTGGGAPVSEGYYVQPTVLADVNQRMKVVREEIFGPVLVAQRFDDLDAIAALANDSPFGLGASIWSRDLSAVHRLIPKLRSGMVWVNCHGNVDPAVPFGGVKQSGFGRDLAHSALDHYTEIKSVSIKL